MENPELYVTSDIPMTKQKIILEKHWQFIKWSDSPESIIDLGIGDGRVAKQIILPHIPTNIKEYIGVDLSQPMLDYSKSIVDHPKYKSIKMDISTKDIPLEYYHRFDKAFACFLLHMIGPNVKQALINIRTFLKPGGQLIFSVVDKMIMDEAYENLDKTKWSKFDHSKYISQFWKSKSPFEEYKKLSKEIGFQEDVFSFYPDEPVVVPNENSMRDIMESLNMVLKEVPKEEYPEYIEEYIDQLKKSSFFSKNEKTGEIYVKMKFIVGVVTKPL